MTFGPDSARTVQTFLSGGSAPAPEEGPPIAKTPNFTQNPVYGSAAVAASADSSYTAPAHAVTIVTATGPRQFTDGGTTSGSYTVTSTAKAQFKNGDYGRPISGSGIPAGAVILAVKSATAIVISKPATATASTVTLTLGGTSGMKIEQVTAVGNSATVTKAGMVNIFLKDPTGNFHFQETFKITAVTPSATTAPFGAAVGTTLGTWKPPNLFLPANWSLCATSFVATQFITVAAFGGAY